MGSPHPTVNNIILQPLATRKCHPILPSVPVRIPLFSDPFPFPWRLFILHSHHTPLLYCEPEDRTGETEAEREKKFTCTECP